METGGDTTKTIKTFEEKKTLRNLTMGRTTDYETFLKTGGEKTKTFKIFEKMALRNLEKDNRR